MDQSDRISARKKVLIEAASAIGVICVFFIFALLFFPSKNINYNSWAIGALVSSIFALVFIIIFNRNNTKIMSITANALAIIFECFGILSLTMINGDSTNLIASMITMMPCTVLISNVIIKKRNARQI